MQQKKRINVLFVSPGYKPYIGGTERIIEQIGNEFLQSGHVARVGVLTTFMDFNVSPPNENRNLPSRETIDGIEVFRLHFSPRRLRLFYTLPAGLFSTKVRQVIRDFQPDVIHFLLNEWYVANLWIYWLTRKCSKHVMLIPFHEPPDNFHFLLMKWIISFLGRRVDQVHVSCSHIKDRAAEYYGIPKDKIEVIPLGLTSNSRSQGQGGNRSGEPLTLISVGRLALEKGQLELVRLFHQVRERFNKQVRLVLVGGDGGHREAIEEFIRQNQLEDSVHIAGFVSQESLEALYRESDIFILLTRNESFCLAFAEALSYGIPCIGYAIGALETSFTQGVVLVEPFDSNAVANRLQELVNDDALRMRLGQEAHEFAWKAFSWKTTCERLLRLYQGANKD
ncbi:MAG TPA: glycosyltransferase family 4 protein [bacterium]|nr:glycosyltransferase family 4 protein [bacterium]